MTGEFAFGDSRIDGAKCPALQAGCEPASDDYLLEFVELYDTVASNRSENHEGVVSEEAARELWLATLGRVEGSVRQRGLKVAEELGWER